MTVHSWFIKMVPQKKKPETKSPIYPLWKVLKKTANLLIFFLPYFILFFIFLVLLLSIILLAVLFRQKLFFQKGFILIIAILGTVGAFFWLRHVTHEYLEDIPHVQDSAMMVFSSKDPSKREIFTSPPPNIQKVLKLARFTVFKDGKMFGQYPIGTPLFYAVGAFFGHIEVMPAIAGALLLFVVFLIGRKVMSGIWGLLAAGLLFCSPFFQMTAPNFMVTYNRGIVSCFKYLLHDTNG